LPLAPIRMEVIYRRISSFSQLGSAGSKIIRPNASHLRFVILKCPAANSLILKS
jgi:hypothetical protein